LPRSAGSAFLLIAKDSNYGAAGLFEAGSDLIPDEVCVGSTGSDQALSNQIGEERIDEIVWGIIEREVRAAAAPPVREPSLSAHETDRPAMVAKRKALRSFKGYAFALVSALMWLPGRKEPESLRNLEFGFIRAVNTHLTPVAFHAI
jgi:hypothetical protein